MQALRLFGLVALCVFAAISNAQVPSMISYQGRIAVGQTNFDGNGQFKFALVNSDGTHTFWSNNNSSAAGSEPTAAITLPVSKGLYSVLLGDTSISGMAAIPPSVFNNSHVRLRIWFDDGSRGFQQLTPDQRISSVGFAMHAATVTDGAITGGKIAQGAVGALHVATGAIAANHIASGAVGAAQLAAGAVTHEKIASTPYLAVDEVGQLHVKGLSTGELEAGLVTFTTEGTTGTSSTGVTLVNAPELINGTLAEPSGSDPTPTFSPGPRTVSTCTFRRLLTSDRHWAAWVKDAVEDRAYLRVVRLEFAPGVTVTLPDSFPTGYRIEQGPNGSFYETLTVKPNRYEIP
jgi:hypothetical protein